jgi:hypothetical protein
MSRKRIRVGTALVLTACGGAPTVDSNPPISNAQAIPCSAQAGEMKTFMRDLFEDRPVAAPWATGDAALDREIEARRVELREALVFDPEKPASPIAANRGPGALDRELASCPRATDQLTKVGNAWTREEKVAAWVGIADAIESCECRPRISYLKPLFYLLARGPD